MGAEWSLRRALAGTLANAARPIQCAVGLFATAFAGLAYSLFPYLVVDRITIHEAAAAPGSLWIILFGVAITLPVIVGYSAYTYRVFRGKARPLRYD